MEERKFQKIYKNKCAQYRYIPSIIQKKVNRVICLGDIHGDYELAIKMLTSAGLIRFKNNTNYYQKGGLVESNYLTNSLTKSTDVEWIGGETHVVQVGDQIDRCRPVAGMSCDNPHTTDDDEGNDIRIMEMFNELDRQAQKVGGAVISLLGNHELMNSMGYLDYVSYEGLKEFENYVDPNDKNIRFKSGYDARLHAFKPGNEYAVMMGCTRVPAVIIGSNLFVHAGIVDALINEIGLKGLDDLERINIWIRSWLLDELDYKYVENIINSSKHSMFWTRVLGRIPPGISMKNNACSKHITKILKIFKIGHLIIGHTPQSFLYSKDINSTCDDKVWRVDNGSSSAFNKYDPMKMQSGITSDSRRMQYLEILNDTQYNVCDVMGCKASLPFI